MSRIAPCLWFASEAEKAANFYVSLLPDSCIERVQRNIEDGPGGKAGSVLVVDFTLAGQSFMALNGGIPMDYTHAVSFSINCDTQAEIDRLWEALLADGGMEEQCGWLRDRYGIPWQIVPSIMPRLLADPDQARGARVMRAMMGMIKLDIAALEAARDGG